MKFSDKNVEEATQAVFKSSELRGNVEVTFASNDCSDSFGKLGQFHDMKLYDQGLLSSAVTELMTAFTIGNRSHIIGIIIVIIID